MITQKFNQGKNEITIESAETLEDAEANDFPPGIYNKFYINGKKVDNYMAIIRYIIEETKKNKTKLVADKDKLIEQRNEMLKNQQKLLKKSLMDLKRQYSDMNIPEEYFKNIDKYFEKIDEFGVRREK